ncbi:MULTISPECIES: glycosyltransferase family 4 protein [Massilia]|uniref:Glycosyltransferase family 4 protein n=1 Tax=Massilia haematophila TaxID=457923 RepID=A0ABV7PGY4_9BURK|nr:glycosyltransferase family 4 protein [Massilia sp.]
MTQEHAMSFPGHQGVAEGSAFAGCAHQPETTRHVVIATWFYEEQPGYLDFRYRIRALATRYRVTLLLRHAFFEQEFADLPLEIQVISTAGTGMREQYDYMRACARFCRGRSADLVVLLGSQLAITAWLLRGLPTLLYWNEHPSHFFSQEHRGLLRRLVSKALLKLSYAGADRVAAVMPIGEAHFQDLADHGVAARRLALLYMGVEDRFGVLAQVRRSGQLRLIYTGTVMRERGRDVMLDGLALARGRGLDAALTIVGASDAQLAYCLQRAVELGIADAVRIVGRVPGSEIPAYLADADVGICIWEDRLWWRFNPPTKLFEYLVAGLPVLGSRIRTHSDYIIHGDNGWIFDYDKEAFAAAIATVVQERARLQEVARAARLSGKRYLWSAIEPRFLELVEHAMADRAATR